MTSKRGGLDARFQPLPLSRRDRQRPDNGEVEAFGQLPDGRFIAIGEKQFDAEGNILGWAWRGAEHDALRHRAL